MVDPTCQNVEHVEKTSECPPNMSGLIDAGKRGTLSNQAHYGRDLHWTGFPLVHPAVKLVQRFSIRSSAFVGLLGYEVFLKSYEPFNR